MAAENDPGLNRAITQVQTVIFGRSQELTAPLTLQTDGLEAQGQTAKSDGHHGRFEEELQEAYYHMTGGFVLHIFLATYDQSENAVTITKLNPYFTDNNGFGRALLQEIFIDGNGDVEEYDEVLVENDEIDEDREMTPGSAVPNPFQLPAILFKEYLDRLTVAERAKRLLLQSDETILPEPINAAAAELDSLEDSEASAQEMLNALSELARLLDTISSAERIFPKEEEWDALAVIE